MVIEFFVSIIYIIDIDTEVFMKLLIFNLKYHQYFPPTQKMIFTILICF